MDCGLTYTENRYMITFVPDRGAGFELQLSLDEMSDLRNWFDKAFRSDMIVKYEALKEGTA